MPPTEPTLEASEPHYPAGVRLAPSPLRRLGLVAGVLLLLLAVVLLPPLLNVNRFKSSIASSIGASLGRVVHIDRVTMNLLPLPGFTLENLVVGEDPAFGSEPIIRANRVRATLRVRSLWRGRVEFSTISFTEPSINLVHTAQGRWNLQNILLQAERIDTAPTSQSAPGPAPRFPYIEAKGARVNFKQQLEKLPFSLTDAEFALWMPEPQQWRLRLEARPARTDTNAADPGTLRVEGTLGRASTLADVAIDLTGEWRDVLLGEASRILLGRDAGWRGRMTLTTRARGTFRDNAVTSELALDGVRRADFVPAQPLTADILCRLQVTALFHTLSQVQCHWPLQGQRPVDAVDLTGGWGDIRQPASAAFTASSVSLPAATLLQWARIASARIPPSLDATGTLAGSLSYSGDPAFPTRWNAAFQAPRATLTADELGPDPVAFSDLDLRTMDPAIPARPAVLPVPGQTTLQSGPYPPTTPLPAATAIPLVGQTLVDQTLVGQTAIDLGGNDPALLQASFDRTGSLLHLRGPALPSRLIALGHAIPQLGDGLEDALPSPTPEAPIPFSLTATRTWGTPQLWTIDARQTPRPRRVARRHKRPR